MHKVNSFLRRGTQKIVEAGLESVRPFGEMKAEQQLGAAAFIQEVDIQELGQLAAEQIEQGRTAARLIMMDLGIGKISPETAKDLIHGYKPPEA